MTPQPPRLTPLHYQVVCVLGLLLVLAGQFLQGLLLANLLVVVTGLGALVTLRPRGPLLFLVLFSLVQLVAAEQRRDYPVSEGPSLFDPVNGMLAAGVLVFLGSLYRLQGLKVHIVPPEVRLRPARPRSDDAAPLPMHPQTRPASALRAEELASFLLAVPMYVLAGQGFALSVQQRVRIGDLSPQFQQVTLLVWLAVVGTLIVSAFFRYLRRAQGSPDMARMYLQETVWREARRDHARIGRWLAWWKQRRRK